MIAYITKKVLYGILVLFGVVSLIFLMFFLKPGDPARMMGGQHASPEAIRAIKKDLGLDLPFYKQYLFYLNDLSVLSIHNRKDEDSHTYLDEEKYDHLTLFTTENRAIVLKFPYLRRSYQSKKEVAVIIREHLLPTVILAFTSIFLATLVGILLGVLSSIRRGSFMDNSFLSITVFGMSLPSYAMAIYFSFLFGYLWTDQTNIPAIPIYSMGFGLILGLFFYIKQKRVQKTGNTTRFGGSKLLEFTSKGLGIGVIFWFLGVGINGMAQKSIIPFLQTYIQLPGTGLPMSGSLYEVDAFTGEHLALQNLILPAITLGIRPLAIVLQLTRSSMLDVLSQDYIRTAKAKGLAFYRVVIKHALKNALNPVVTAVSGWFASLLAGAIFVERIFGWNGLGHVLVDSLQKDDLPVVMGIVMVIAVTFVLINILIDIVYGLLDPRVRIT